LSQDRWLKLLERGALIPERGLRITLLGVFAAVTLAIAAACDGPADAAAQLSATAVTRGGEDGRTIAVNTLEDSGPGSLRDAIEQTGPRRIVFKIAGEIWLKSPLVVREPFVTIAGETAGSPGISLMGDTFRVRGHDVIVRHIRVRVGALAGASSAQNRDGIAIDGSTSGEKPAYNILIENCSVAWSVDEGLTIYGPGSNNIVIRNNIVAEALLRSIHPKGPHSMGVLIGPLTRDILIEGNIMASNRLRNPVVSAGASAVIVNNLIYNPGGAALHFYSRRNTEPTIVTAVGNLVVAGPNTKPVLAAFQQGMAAGSKIFFRDNRAEGTSAFDTNETMPGGEPAPFVDTMPIWRSGLSPLPASNVKAAAIKNAGARPWNRDETDTRIIAEIQNGGGAIPDQPAIKALAATQTALSDKAERRAARRNCRQNGIGC
jgi:hypothetical protein